MTPAEGSQPTSVGPVAGDTEMTTDHIIQEVEANRHPTSEFIGTPSRLRNSGGVLLRTLRNVCKCVDQGNFSAAHGMTSLSRLRT